MTQDSMFPELEPQPPLWPGKPEVVAHGHVQQGGRCAHCDTFLPRDKAIYKLAPACCLDHLVIQKRAKNGPGKWVCAPCRWSLAPEEGVE